MDTPGMTGILIPTPMELQPPNRAARQTRPQIRQEVNGYMKVVSCRALHTGPIVFGSLETPSVPEFGYLGAMGAWLRREGQVETKSAITSGCAERQIQWRSLRL
jgi:hypothetical protein